MSHGQTSVERGFSVNKDVIETNMEERTMIAQRYICDGISNLLSKEDQGDVSKIIINDKMLKYCREARSRYRNFLDEIKKDAEKSAEDIKKSAIKDEIAREKEVEEKLKKVIKRRRCEVDTLSDRAEKEHWMAKWLER